MAGDHLRGIGAEKVAVMPTAGHPVVYGEWLKAGPNKPTVLVYGHYDVVPAAIEDGWDTPPFEPVEKDGKIYARGATDDKGQLFIHVKALESYLKSGDGPPVNLKFLLEGEEEISSPNLRPFIESHLDLLKADVCVISDSSMPTIDEPAIMHSLRGMTYIEVEVEGPHEDLHSGFYGGAVHNPALALVEILSKLHNPDHSIAVPGFYDDVVPLTQAERAEVAKTAISEEQLMASTGAPAVWGEDGLHDPRARLCPPDTGDQWPVERLDRPRTQDHHPGKSDDQNQLPLGRQSGSAQDLSSSYSNTSSRSHRRP